MRVRVRERAPLLSPPFPRTPASLLLYPWFRDKLKCLAYDIVYSYSRITDVIRVYVILQARSRNIIGVQYIALHESAWY